MGHGLQLLLFLKGVSSYASVKILKHKIRAPPGGVEMKALWSGNFVPPKTRSSFFAVISL